MHLSDELLSAYLDGEMPPAEATAARSHLGQCASCAGALRLFTALDEGLAASPALECAVAAGFLSAKLDGELGAEEAAMASAHLSTCADCRSEVAGWSALEHSLVALPHASPSRKVDAAIAALVREPAARRVPRLGAAIPSVAVVTALTLLLVASLPVTSPQPSTPAAQTAPLVAAVQQVLNPNTSTLYVLQPENATVSAVDSTTGEQKSLIFVGGKPTALSINVATNTVYVLDGTNKTVTAIDGARAAVTSSTVVTMPGTPTSIQVDQMNNKVVVGASAPDTTLPASPVGVIATLDGGTKQVETVREIEVAPNVIVPEPNGKRILLVSLKSTILADAATYQPLLTTVGGVGAAFSASRNEFAVLSNGPTGAKLTFAGAKNSIVLGGTPRAVTALPGGGFAILADLAGAGVISIVNADGVLSQTVAAPLNARDLAYDAMTRKFAVILASGVTSVPLPDSVVQVPPLAATGSPLPTVAPQPSASGSPSASAAPSATPTLAPTEAPIVLAARDSDTLVPAGARAMWPGTYFLSLGAGRRPAQAIGGGDKIWFLDQTNRVWVMHVESNELFNIGVLPRGATISHVAMTPNHVYFLEAAANMLYVITINSEQLTTVRLPIPTVATAIAGSPDERLWLATKGSGLVSFDPRNSRIETVNVGFDLAVVATDATGRVWTASRDRAALDLYEPLSGKLTEYALGHSGAITALTVDRSNVAWVGTSAGEVLAMRSGANGLGSLVATGAVGRAITSLEQDASGALYYSSAGAAGLTYGPIRAPARTVTTPSTASEPMFDSLGRVWQADSGGGFYITLPGARP